MRAASAVVAIAGLAALALLGGCGGSGGGNESGLSGTVRTDGSSELGPYLLEAAEDFQDANEDVRVTVGVSGSEGGIERFCAGEVDIAAAPRAMTAEELKRCREQDREIVSVPIATDATVLVGSPGFEVRCLTVAQYDRLIPADGKPGGVDSLSELGDDPDTGEALPGEDVTVLRAGEGHDTPEEVIHRVSDGDSTLGAVPYSGYKATGVGGLTVVSIDAGRGCSPPGSETISDASYPFTYPLFLYVDGAAQAQKPELSAFLGWLADHQDTDADAAHVQPLPEDGARGAARLLHGS